MHILSITSTDLLNVCSVRNGWCAKARTTSSNKIVFSLKNENKVNGGWASTFYKSSFRFKSFPSLLCLIWDTALLLDDSCTFYGESVTLRNLRALGWSPHTTPANHQNIKIKHCQRLEPCIRKSVTCKYGLFNVYGLSIPSKLVV